uniref:Uncharacterized protein n=1 Tax=Clytia hemisphaerica TaxID=252671 RepID=A0A7M5X5E8_9CNID
MEKTNEVNYRELYEQARQQIEELVQQNHQLKIENDNLQSKASPKTSLIGAEQIKQLETELASYKQKINRQDQDNIQLKNMLRIANEKVEENSRRERAVLEQSMRQMQELKIQLEEYACKVEFLEKDNNDLQADLESADKEIEDVDQQNEALERRLEETIVEQNGLDFWIRKLVKEKREQRGQYEKSLAEAHSEIRMSNITKDKLSEQLAKSEADLKTVVHSHAIQMNHDLTIQIGLKHLKDCLQKKSLFSTLFKSRTTACKLDVVQKLLAHVGGALNTAAYFH